MDHLSSSQRQIIELNCHLPRHGTAQHTTLAHTASCELSSERKNSHNSSLAGGGVKMEGVGSRLGRASSRYGPATVFTGPVRKWKKRWVHVSSSSSSSSTISYRNNNNNNGPRPNTNNGNGNGSGSSTSTSNNASALLLCRWTPISPSHTADSDNSSIKLEEPPRRKFRYTPIVVLEQKKEAAEKVDDKAKTRRAHSLTIGTTTKSDDAYENPIMKGVFMEEIQAGNTNRLVQQHSNTSHINLDLCYHEQDGEKEEAELVRLSSGGFRA